MTDDMTAVELRVLLDYNPVSGVFVWRSRPEINKYRKIWNTKYGGTIAGSLDERGYRRTKVGGRFQKAHRLAWLYVRGEWPSRLIDHIDENPLNNAISNLRLASQAQNMSNRGPQRNNTSGVKGVSYNAKQRRWCACIWKNGRSYWLGGYKDREQAAAAYLDASRKLHGEFAHP